MCIASNWFLGIFLVSSTINIVFSVVESSGGEKTIVGVFINGLSCFKECSVKSWYCDIGIFE